MGLLLVLLIVTRSLGARLLGLVLITLTPLEGVVAMS